MYKIDRRGGVQKSYTRNIPYHVITYFYPENTEVQMFSFESTYFYIENNRFDPEILNLNPRNWDVNLGLTCRADMN